MLLAYRRRAPALRGSRASHLRHRWTRRRGRRVGTCLGRGRRRQRFGPRRHGGQLSV